MPFFKDNSGLNFNEFSVLILFWDNILMISLSIAASPSLDALIILGI